MSNTFEDIMFSFDVTGYAETLVVAVEEYVEETDSNEQSFIVEYQRVGEEPIQYLSEID